MECIMGACLRARVKIQFFFFPVDGIQLRLFNIILHLFFYRACLMSHCQSLKGKSHFFCQCQGFWDMRYFFVTVPKPLKVLNWKKYLLGQFYRSKRIIQGFICIFHQIMSKIFDISASRYFNLSLWIHLKLNQIPTPTSITSFMNVP